MPLLQKLEKINVNVNAPGVGTSVNVKSPPEVCTVKKRAYKMVYIVAY